MPCHEVSVETLHHFSCGSCGKWWSIGDWVKQDTITCPSCGCKLGIKEVGTNVVEEVKVDYSGYIGKTALINLNDETGGDLYSVECEDDVGNWIDSFLTLEAAVDFIICIPMEYTKANFRDTRYKKSGVV